MPNTYRSTKIPRIPEPVRWKRYQLAMEKAPMADRRITARRLRIGMVALRRNSWQNCCLSSRKKATDARLTPAASPFARGGHPI